MRMDGIFTWAEYFRWFLAGAKPGMEIWGSIMELRNGGLKAWDYIL